MINIIWFILISSSIIVAVFTGRITEVNNMVLESAISSIKLVIRLFGPMILWLGIMNIIREAKITELVTTILKPFFKFLFPEIPAKSPAAGAILLNFSANILGLGNSATPLGINAMRELQNINLDKKKASSAMCTLLALNTSSLTLLPTTIISLRIAAGSTTPTIITFTTIFATLVSTITAIILDKTFRLFKKQVD